MRRDKYRAQISIQLYCNKNQMFLLNCKSSIRIMILLAPIDNKLHALPNGRNQIRLLAEIGLLTI